VSTNFKHQILNNQKSTLKKHNIHPTENWYTDTAGSPECKNKTNQYREKVSLSSWDDISPL
jgi:hypothetical protein